MTREILFDNWRIEKPIRTIARQYDNLSRSLIVSGDIPNEYVWEMLVQCGDYFDAILLTGPSDGMLSAVLTRDQLSLSGRYTMQLRGTKGDEVRHTNCIDIDIPSSLSGDGVWPEVPSEFSQMEERLNDLYAHPPRPGSNGTWMLWDVDAQKYEDSDIPLPESGGYGNIASAEINEIKVLDLDEYKSIEEKDSKTLYLIRG